MTGLGQMHRRITLMREETVQGAGGRMLRTTPIIADVWAAVEETPGGAIERGDKQIFTNSARFTVRFARKYLMARVVEWRGARYRITGTGTTREGTPSISFSAQLMEGEQL